MPLVIDAAQTINAALERLNHYPATSINGAQCVIVTEYEASRFGPAHLHGITRNDTSTWYRFTVMSNWERRTRQYLGCEFAYLSSNSELAIQAKRTWPKKRPVLLVINPTTYPKRYLRLLLEGVDLLGYTDNHPTIFEVKEPPGSSALKLIGSRTYYDHHPLLRAGCNFD